MSGTIFDKHFGPQAPPPRPVARGDEHALTTKERTAIRKASDLLDAAQAEEVREEGAPDKNIAGAIDILEGLAGDESGS